MIDVIWYGHADAGRFLRFLGTPNRARASTAHFSLKRHYNTLDHQREYHMSFSDSFWTSDYNLGCRILFTQLYEGIKENESFVVMFKKRLELELVYGQQLTDINQTPISDRFQNEDYVLTIKTAFTQINENFANEGNYHIAISEDINAKVVEPFANWCADHKLRVEFSDNVLLEKYKAFKAFKAKLEKFQKRYFNKCRILEEFKANFDGELTHVSDNESVDDNDYDDSIFKIGDLTFTEKQFKGLLRDMLNNLELKDHKVAILGTYANVSTGSSIAQWLSKNVENLNDIDKLEKFGKDLMTQGYLRLIGTINQNVFLNSSQFYYQWKPKTFELAGTLGNPLGTRASLSSSGINDYFEDMKQVIGVNIDFNDKSQYVKLGQEVNMLDQQYYHGVVELDKMRCEFEELIMDHLTFMEKCELDRLKAIKKVLLDFIQVFRPYFKTTKALYDELLILEETINPVNDLKFLIENFQIGKFKPIVTLYDNYYNSNVNQIFGVDLSIKSRLDKKVVPILVQCILSHLDKVYPDLLNDQERVNLWTNPVQLSTIHSLRFQLNQLTTTAEINTVLQSQHPRIVTNVLKLYLLELPDSLILHNYFEIIKSLYLSYPAHINDDLDKSRLNGLQNVLGELPKCNLATLDALLTHLNRLVQIISKKDELLGSNFRLVLAKELASIIILPKRDHLTEGFQVQFVLDLFEHKDDIFKPLRRNNSKPGPLTKLKEETRKPEKAETRKPEKTDGIQLPDLPQTPRKDEPSLKRSNLPTKSSLNSYLDPPGSKTSSTSTISSNPSRKDIDVSEFSQPKFTTIGRKSSVKDLASKFENNDSTSSFHSTSST